MALNTATGELHHFNGPAAVFYALILEHGVEQAVKKVEHQFGSEAAAELPDLLGAMVEKGLLVDD